MTHDDPAPSFELDEFETRADLERKAGWYARLLDRQVPLGCRVADLGCGTGRLSCLLALRGRRVVGVDYSPGSLERARALAAKLGIDTVEFRVGDITDLDLPDGSFDVVISHGVLQNLPDPRAGFGHVARVTAPGGHALVGLYNRYGRLTFQVLRAWMRLTGLATPARERACVVRAFDLAGRPESEIQAYVQDQFHEPREKTFTLGEILSWFREVGLEWVGSYPPIGVARAARRAALLVGSSGPLPAPPGRLARLAAQVRWALDLRDLGGLVVVSGRKRHGRTSS